VTAHDPGKSPTGERPYTLVAELTYRCPLQCVYCSNPLDLGKHRQEIDSATWTRVIGEAEGLGIVQVNLTGANRWCWPIWRDRRRGTASPDVHEPHHEWRAAGRSASRD
jgi:hypothetical protein